MKSCPLGFLVLDQIPFPSLHEPWDKQRCVKAPVDVLPKAVQGVMTSYLLPRQCQHIQVPQSSGALQLNSDNKTHPLLHILARYWFPAYICKTMASAPFPEVSLLSCVNCLPSSKPLPGQWFDDPNAQAFIPLAKFTSRSRPPRWTNRVFFKLPMFSNLIADYLFCIFRNHYDGVNIQ